MSIVGELVIQLGQVAIEGGSELVHKKYGWLGCLGLFVAVGATIALVIWLL